MFSNFSLSEIDMVKLIFLFETLKLSKLIKFFFKDFFKGITFDCMAFCSNKAVSTSSNK